MTDKQTLLELAERCEKATGPDRELDLSIMRHAMNIGGPPENAAPYTASIDAAMTLVPEGWDGALYLATDTHGPQVQLETPAMRLAFTMDDEMAEASAATLALALTVAALRALASEKESGR